MRRRRFLVAGVAASAALATIAVGSTGAYFTASSTTAGQTGSASSLPAVATFAATKSGGPTGASSTLSWDAPTLQGWTESGVSSTPTYSVRRSLSGDFSATGDSVDLGTTPDRTLLDSAGGASFRQREVTDVAGAHNGVTRVGVAMMAVMGGQAYYWGRITSSLESIGVPALVTGIPDQVVKVAVGVDHGCALTVTSRIFCVGDNTNGELGNGANGSSAAQTTAVEVSSYDAFNSERIVAIGAGEDFSCALTSKGTIGCWGKNNYGQLGLDGDTADKNSPKRVGKANNVVADAFATNKPIQMSVGPWGVCAVKGAASGTNAAPAAPVACWGRSNWRQHGTAYNSNDTTPHSVPVDIPDPNGVLTGATQVKVSHGVTCVLNGKTAPTTNIACWGGGGLGLLGDGAGTTWDDPRSLNTTFTGATTLSVGADTACAFKTNTYVCWGRNGDTQLGRAGVASDAQRADTGAGNRYFFFPDTVSTLPAPFASDTIVGAASAPATNCVVTSKAGLACWGENGTGQLARGSTSTTDSGTVAAVTTADGATDPVLSPDAVTAVAKLVAAARGGNRTFALVGDTVYTWGTKNESTSRMPTRTTPTAIAGFPQGITQLVGGEDHVCALVPSGASAGVWCAGGNVLGQVGDGTVVDRSASAVKVVDADGVLAGKTITAIDAGYDSTCALATDGTAACWGDNSKKQVGLASGSYSMKPVKVNGSEISGTDGRPLLLAAGTDHYCVGRAGGGIACWGQAASYRLGTTSSVDTPTPVRVTDSSNYLGTEPVLSIAADWYSTCAVSGSTANLGKVYCWGENRFGQLGTGTKGANDVGYLIAPISSTSRFSNVAVGTRMACAWGPTATECWGTNDEGWLGRNTTGGADVPFAPASIASGGLLSEGVSSLSMGWRQVCGIGSKGGLYCWGRSDEYQTGQGNTTDVLQPTLVKTSNGGSNLAGPGSRMCLNGATLITSTTCSLSPRLPYTYQVTYTVPNATNWVGAAASTLRR
ncbi:hypothetical protein L3i23_26680 [Herbiconiux sp. L3-i23]|nr:hypothetical protein L3i23_26680 [Herbiconiux sp. L3-i23]